MWIFTETGFVSAVKKPQDNGLVSVRARNHASLEPIATRFETKIINTPTGDYPWRTFNPSSPGLWAHFESSIDRMFKHIPNYIYMDGCPEQIRPTLDDLIKAKLLKLAHEQNIDVAAKLARLKELDQSPWQRVDHDLEPIPEATTPATKEQVEELFDYITSPDNTILFWNHIPDAWDGSLNNAASSGFIEGSNSGQLFWTYNAEIGTISKNSYSH